MSRTPLLSVALPGLVMLAVAMGIGRFAFTPLLPMMEQDAGVSLSLGGWLAAANYLGYLLGAYSAMHLRFAPGRIVAVSLLAIAVLTAAMGYTLQPALWLLLRGLAGVASAWVLVFTSTWALGRLAAAGQTQLGGVLFGGVGVGIMLAGFCCMQFLLWGWSSAVSWRALGLAAFILSLAALPALRGGSAAAAPPKDAHRGGAPRVGGLALAYGLFGFGYIIPATFLPAMARHLMPDPARFGWAWPLFGLAALLSTLAAGPLLRRLSNCVLWGASHLIMAVGVLMPVFEPDLAGILVAALCVGGTFMVITSAGIQEARRLAPHDPAPLMAKLTTAFALGQILGPVCVSLLPRGEHAFALLQCVAALLLALSGVALLLRRAES